MTLREKQSAFLLMVAKLLTWNAEQDGELLCLLEWMRSAAQQALNVANGVSWVKYSKHQDGLAMDFCFLNDLKDDGKINWDTERYRKIGEYWEFLGGRWGGRFGAKDGKLGKDCGHFEYLG